MCKIKILGPPSEKYEALKSKILKLAELWDDDFQLVEIRDVNQIVEENINVVPSALFEGEENIIWTEETTVNNMLEQLKSNRKNRDHACRCEGGCKMRKIDPEYSCHE